MTLLFLKYGDIDLDIGGALKINVTVDVTGCSCGSFSTISLEVARKFPLVVVSVVTLVT